MAHMPDEPLNEILLHVIPWEYTSEIAYVVSTWALLEYEIDGAIWDLAGLETTPRIGACLTAQYSTVSARFNALISLARLRGVPDFEIARLNRFKDRVLGLADRRNRVAHDPWLSSMSSKDQPTKTYRLQKTARAKLDYDYKPIELDELKTLRTEIEDAIKEFGEFTLHPTIDTYDVG